MKRKKTKTYDSNFRVVGLLHREFVALKGILKSQNFEGLIKEEEAQNQYMGVPTQAARKRIIAEIRRRYRHSPSNFWDTFFEWDAMEQKFGLFFICLKAYPLLLDIHLDVGLKKFRIGAPLEPYDITMYFDELSSKNDTVATWSDSTFERLNYQYRNMLKELGIYIDGQLTKPNISSAILWTYFEDINESWFLEACFLKS